MIGPCPRGALRAPRRAVVAVGLALISFLLAVPAARAEGCPNAQLRAEDGSLSLPECRAYELVSPAEKNGGSLAAPESLWGGGVLQASASGNAATFSSAASFGGGAVGAPAASQYLATRGAGGWGTRNVTPPTESGAYGQSPEGVPYQLFSGDLSRALMLDGRRCGSGGGCPRSYSLRSGEGALLADSPQAQGLRLAGATPGFSHVVLQSCAALSAEAVEEPEGEGCKEADTNLYEWSGGGLTLVNASKGEILPPPFGRLPAQAGAISEDGRRVYWYQLEDGPLRLYEEGQPTRALPETTGGGAAFQTASVDGAYAFYIVGATLYRYSAAARSSIVVATGVKGVLGASADGGVVYYQDATGLRRWDQGTTTLLAAGPEAAAAGDYPPTTGTARVSADGAALAFLSTEPLTGYDNRDVATGQADSEVFLWDPAAGLVCASCRPTGARPSGPSTIPGAIADGAGPSATDSYKPRSMSGDGRRIFFDSSDQVTVADAGAAQDVYEWEAPGEGPAAAPCSPASPSYGAAAGGCLALISSGASAYPSTFVDASESGEDAFFLTADSLVPTDPGALDLYDARVEGGVPMPGRPIPCDGDACQAVPSPPEDPSVDTLAPGAPDPEPHYAGQAKACAKGKRAVRRKGRQICVARKHHKKKTRRHRGRHGVRHRHRKGTRG